jgi:protein-S-isoprenylcysteine O-methyltransferase Ste14
MYLGIVLALLGWAAFLANAAALAVVPAFVAWMNAFQIAPEERALAAKFGAAFSGYREKVRRWI